MMQSKILLPWLVLLCFYPAIAESSDADSICRTTSFGAARRPVLETGINRALYRGGYRNTDSTLGNFSGLTIKEAPTWSVTPLLNYIFFEAGSSVIPSRYVIFSSGEKTTAFSDETLPGATLDKYYHVLNIYGYRLRHFPETAIEIIGCSDNTLPSEKRPGLPEERAQQVYNYFRDIWGISENRMKLVARKLPEMPSNPRDSLGIQENRRVEIQSKNWELLKPMPGRIGARIPDPADIRCIVRNTIDRQLIARQRLEISYDGRLWKTIQDIGITDTGYLWNWKGTNGELPDHASRQEFSAQYIITDRNGNECRSNPVIIPVRHVELPRHPDLPSANIPEHYSLIQFPLNRYEPGPLNERILREFIYDRITPNSEITLIFRPVYMVNEEFSAAMYRLMQKRARTLEGIIKTGTGGKYKSLVHDARQDEILYDNSLPEGRFYNRSIDIEIRTSFPAQD